MKTSDLRKVYPSTSSRLWYGINSKGEERGFRTKGEAEGWAGIKYSMSYYPSNAFYIFPNDLSEEILRESYKVPLGVVVVPIGKIKLGLDPGQVKSENCASLKSNFN